MSNGANNVVPEVRHVPGEILPTQASGRGVTIWLTGLSGAGKSTLASALAAELELRGRAVEVLDGDVVRENLSKGLGFSKEDRDTNIRRIGFVAQLLTRHGVFVIASAISPYREVRDEVRALIGDFIEVHVDCTLEADPPRRQGPLRQGAARRDQELHRGQRPLRGAAQPRGAG